MAASPKGRAPDNVGNAQGSIARQWQTNDAARTARTCCTIILNERQGLSCPLAATVSRNVGLVRGVLSGHPSQPLPVTRKFEDEKRAPDISPTNLPRAPCSNEPARRRCPITLRG